MLGRNATAKKIVSSTSGHSTTGQANEYDQKYTAIAPKMGQRCPQSLRYILYAATHSSAISWSKNKLGLSRLLAGGGPRSRLARPAEPVVSSALVQKIR